MKKKLKCHFIIVCLICLLSACSANTNNKSVKEEQPSSIETLCTITTPKMGDSKLFFDKILASTDGHLILFNFDGSIFKEFTNIPTNWIYPCESEHFVIAGNFNNEIRMVQFNEDYSVKSDKVLFRSSNLMIDPVILKADGKYLLTYTEIEGNVNNGDPSVENGVYMVRCYESQDLETWNKVSDMFEKDGVL